ncbi:MAG: hypothetical protein FWG75_00990 [Cystobacterineae bacterium]|nr:hypothetical protein [Cystobacterineae bacterium]
MEIALIFLLSAICLYLLFFRRGSTPASQPTSKNLPAKAESNKAENPMASEQEALLAKTAELQKTKGEFQKLKDELKQSKQKLFEAREKNKQWEAELKAQKQLERQALQEAENARLNSAELSTELSKLRLELETQKPFAKTSAPAAPSQTPAAEPPRPAKLLRELNPAEKEKLENAERLVAAEHSRTQELEKELKNLKVRFELAQRQLKSFRSSGKLQKDKFRALEKRLNRTLLEKDLVLRAMYELENRCGLQASIVELPDKELASEKPGDASEFAEITEEFEKMDMPSLEKPQDESKENRP